MVKISINPMQWVATADGWIDWTAWPEPDVLHGELKDAGWKVTQIGVPVGMSIKEYQKSLDRFDMSLSPGYMSGQLHDPAQRAEIVQRFRDFAIQHAQLGLTEMFVACHMDRAAARVQKPGVSVESNEERLDEIAESLDEIGRATREEGVTSLVHAHTGTWIETDDEIEYILAKVGEDVLGLGPDTGQLITSGSDPVDFINRHGSRIGGLHIKDVNAAVLKHARETDAPYRETVLAGLWAEPGLGDVPLDQCIDALPSTFGGWCVIEVDRPTIWPPVESARECANWARAHSSNA